MKRIKNIWNYTYYGNRVFLLTLIAAAIVIFWHIPTPHGLSDSAWRLFIVFICTIAGILLKVMPISAFTFAVLTLICVTNLLEPGSVDKNIGLALNSFSDSVIWLVVSAFFISRAIVKTGFWKRIAYIFIKYFGKNSISLAYGIAISDLILAPAMPSNTARNAGVIYPILNSLAQCFGSSPKDGTQKKIGAYLMMTQFQCDTVISGMFLTSMAANLLCAKLAETMNIHITWTSWFLAALVPCLVSLMITPLICYKLYPPEITKMSNASEFGSAELRKMGKISNKEIVVILTFILLLVLWVFESSIGISATAVAFIGLAILLLLLSYGFRYFL